MFARLYTLSTFALLAVATAIPDGAPASSCSTGSLQCCNQVVDATSNEALGILGPFLGEIGEALTGLVGITCSPISSQGAGNGNACTASPVCCTDNSFGSLFSLGCAPFTL